jgi:hypothetical protein
MRLLKYVLVAALAAAPAVMIAQTPAQDTPKAPIARRAFNQQRRIGEGIRNGRINAHQGARLERQQMRIHRQAHMMRVRHNGRLTMRQRRFINRRQGAASRNIYNAKRHSRRIG